MVLTFSAIGKLYMSRLLRRTKGIEHLDPATPDSESEEETKAQPKERTNGCVSTSFTSSVHEGISVRFLQVMLEMFFCELANIFARVLSEYGKRVGRHGDTVLKPEGLQ